mmetsp:Transcript_23248/g.37894  ORF Transcript_23248/g.37894 Transcript_23248/m.37894 type:complete len:240 (+) Transcript_23248:1836-2555(+)
MHRGHRRVGHHEHGQQRLQIRHGRSLRRNGRCNGQFEQRQLPGQQHVAAGGWRCRPCAGRSGQPHRAAADGGRLPLAGGLSGHVHLHRFLRADPRSWRQHGEHCCGAGRFHRWHHSDGQSHCLRQVERELGIKAVGSARQELPELGRTVPLLVLHVQVFGNLRCRWCVDPVAGGGFGLCHGCPFSGLRGWWRHARLHHRAQLLFRLGLGRGGFLAEESGADHRGVLDRLQRSHPHQDHV